METKKSLIILLLLLIGCSNNVEDQQPAKVVREYFDAWDKEVYEIMYTHISDGFKDIEPTAVSFADFRTYAQLQNIDSVNIISIKQDSNNGKAAIVDYEVEFLVNNNKVPFEGSFTLKNRLNDKIPGWKLIHPYGDKIDNS